MYFLLVSMHVSNGIQYASHVALHLTRSLTVKVLTLINVKSPLSSEKFEN